MLKLSPSPNWISLKIRSGDACPLKKPIASSTEPSVATTSAAGSAASIQAARSFAVNGSSSMITSFIVEEFYGDGKFMLPFLYQHRITGERPVPFTEIDQSCSTGCRLASRPGASLPPLARTSPHIRLLLQIVHHPDPPIGIHHPDRQRPLPCQPIVLYRILDQQLQREHRYISPLPHQSRHVDRESQGLPKPDLLHVQIIDTKLQFPPYQYHTHGMR